MEHKQVIPLEIIENKIFIIRNCKVMLDADLARLYGVFTTRLNEQVKRNESRFPEDFMFQLTEDEYRNLISQFATSRWGGRRKLPYVFTEHGVAMLSSVLKSPRAVAMNIVIIRAFIKLREVLFTHKDLSQKMLEIERIQKEHGSDITHIYSVIKRLISTPPKPKAPIGFVRP